MSEKFNVEGKESDKEIIVHLENGFQRGMWVAKFDGENFITVDSTGECTWNGDEEVDRDVKLSADFKGVIGGFYGVSAHTTLNHVKFVGFSEEELQAKPSTTCFVIDDVGFGAKDVKQVETMKDFLEAKARGLELITVDELGDGVHSLPYRWGDQPANCFVVIKDGQIELMMKGAGDSTPELVDDWEKLYADENYYEMFTSPREENIKSLAEQEVEEKLKKEREEDKFYESFYPNDPKGLRRKF